MPNNDVIPWRTLQWLPGHTTLIARILSVAKDDWDVRNRTVRLSLSKPVGRHRETRYGRPVTQGWTSKNECGTTRMSELTQPSPLSISTSPTRIFD